MNPEPAVDSSRVESPLLEAKLAVPRLRAGVIPRERLFDALDRLENSELTVVSGPAGAGKTVVITSWLAARPELATAWATLDVGDDDAVRLWTYISHAVDRVRPGLGRPALARLRSPRSSVETAIDELLNGLVGYDGRLVIVLDDFHRVTSESCVRSLAYAVERLPPTTRMIVTTRSDPGRRLSRLRARGGLGELRAKDIAFTLEEAHELVVTRAGVPVTEEDVRILVDRTEGWPAGVGLAALWLAIIDEPREGIRQFSATHRHVADYLAAEVLDTVDDETRDFLLRTSIFDRFSARSSAAVLGTESSGRLLADLERSNLFLVALDEQGCWYRYHHLFRELLRLQLADSAPETVPELHRRAAAWFHANGLTEEALAHAAAVDQDEVARLLATEHLKLMRDGKVDVFVRYLDMLSDEVLGRHPVVAAAGTSSLLRRPTSERERLAAIAEDRLTQLSCEEQRYVAVAVAMSRAAYLDQEIGVMLGHAERAVELARNEIRALLVPALALLAYAHYFAGNVAAARAAAEEAIAQPHASTQQHGFIHARALRALVECEEGRPHTAETIARETVAGARELGLAGSWTAGIAHHALGRALLQLGKAQEAERELERAEVLRRASQPQLDHAHTLLVLAEARIARGRLTLAETELAAAREQLDAIARVAVLEDLADEVERQLVDARAGSSRPVEPPTPAELAVLRLLATDLSQREIGGELFLSLNTIKTHTRQLYGKLGVRSREDAVRRASVLGLIGAGDSPG